MFHSSLRTRSISSAEPGRPDCPPTIGPRRATRPDSARTFPPRFAVRKLLAIDWAVDEFFMAKATSFRQDGRARARFLASRPPWHRGQAPRKRRLSFRARAPASPLLRRASRSYSLPRRNHEGGLELRREYLYSHRRCSGGERAAKAGRRSQTAAADAHHSRVGTQVRRIKAGSASLPFI